MKGDQASNAIAYRDALDRAGQLADSKDAMKLRARANRRGDETLARATAQQAFDMATSGASFTDPGWGDVVNAFLESRPELSEDMQSLAVSAKPVSTVTELFAFVIPTPSELSGLNDHRLAALADTHSAA